MKKLKTRFAIVPVAEVLEKAVEVDPAKNVERVARKGEPYAVPIETERSLHRCQPRQHEKYDEPR